MSGVAAIRYLLCQAATVTDVIPATRIMGGDLPLETVLPAISVKQVSSIPRTTLSMRGQSLHTERVQVSPVFKGVAGAPAGQGYPAMKAMLRLILAACPNQNGAISGVQVDSILPDAEGPDLYDPVTDMHSGSRDFIVKWLE